MDYSNYLLLLAFAVFLGVIPGIIAHRKGHPFLLWWFFGAALFILALPFAILLKADQNAVEREKLSEGMKKCPHCAELIKREAAVCRYCGRDLDPAPSMLPPPSTIPNHIYYFSIGGTNSGPFTLGDVRQLFQAQALTSTTYVYRSGDSQWRHLSSFPELLQ